MTITKKQFIKKYNPDHLWIIVNYTDDWARFGWGKNKEKCEKTIIEWHFQDKDIYIDDWKIINKYINWKKWVNDLIKENKYEIINLNDYKDDDRLYLKV